MGHCISIDVGCMRRTGGTMDWGAESNAVYAMISTPRKFMNKVRCSAGPSKQCGDLRGVL